MLARELAAVQLPHPALPEDTHLWAALQQVGGGTWGGCVYDAEEIVRRLSDARPNGPNA